MGLGSGIRKKPIPDPGVKKVPDPGVKKVPDPGSATLLGGIEKPTGLSRKWPHKASARLLQSTIQESLASCEVGVVMSTIPKQKQKRSDI